MNGNGIMVCFIKKLSKMCEVRARYMMHLTTLYVCQRCARVSTWMQLESVRG